MTTANEFDRIAVGSGTGATMVDNTVNHDLKVACIDKGPIGETRANAGLTEPKLKAGGHDFLIDEARHITVAKGQAIVEWHGLAKGIIEANEGTTLGSRSFAPMPQSSFRKSQTSRPTTESLEIYLTGCTSTRPCQNWFYPAVTICENPTELLSPFRHAI